MKDLNKVGGRGSAKHQSSMMRIHANPFFVDRDNTYMRNFHDAYGREDLIATVIEDIESYVVDVKNLDKKHFWALAVRGDIGSGKTLFARKLLLELSSHEYQILRPLIKQNNSQFHFRYIVSSGTSNGSLKFLGIWRPFLRQLLEIYSTHEHQSKERIINSQI
jgi:hypothetical protein